jgi:hypothetical protein
VMRKVNADCASGEIYLSSPAPASVDRAYHKILGSVKRWWIVPRKRLPACGNGWGRTWQFSSLGLSRKTALLFGQVTLRSLMPFGGHVLNEERSR